MEDFNHFLKKLLRALRKREERANILHDFQMQIFKHPDPPLGDPVWEILADLAYDLEFYEPDPLVRKEDGSFYGDERVEDEIRSTLNKLREKGLIIPSDV